MIKYIKISDHIPQSIELKKVLFLQDILDKIKSNPYSIDSDFSLAKSYMLGKLKDLKSHTLISEGAILSYMNGILHSLEKGINREQYETIFYNFKIALINEQARLLDSLPENTQQNLTNILFTRLIKEVFLIPHFILQKNDPLHSIYPSNSKLLWRTYRLLHGIMSIKEDIIPWSDPHFKSEFFTHLLPTKV